MALTDFFRINLPYGIAKNAADEWMAFNREYLPLGWNNWKAGQSIDDENSYAGWPVRTRYKNASEEFLQQLIDHVSLVEYDSEGKIKKIFLYDEETNPTNAPEYWGRYFEKLKILSELEKSNRRP